MEELSTVSKTLYTPMIRRIYANKIAQDTIVIEKRKYYSFIKYNSKMKISTKFKMIFSDLFNMIKMVHLKV